MTIFLRIIAGLLIGIGILYIVPPYMSFNDLKPTIEESFLKTTGKAIKIGGDVKLQMVPSVKVSLINTSITITENRILEIPNLELNTGLGIIFSNAPKIKGIKLVGANIDTSLLHALVESTTSKDSNIQIYDWGLENVDLIFSPSDTFDRLADVTGVVSIDPNKSLSIKATFNAYNGEYTIDADLKNGAKDSHFKISTDFGTVEFSGATDWSNKKSISGSLLVELNDKDTKALEQFDSLRILSLDKLVLKSKINVEDKNFDLSDITIASQSIQKGSASLKYEHGGELRFVLNIDNFNLDQMLLQASKTEELTLTDLLKDILTNFSFDVSDKLFGSAEIKINEMLVHGKPIKNIDLYSDIFEGRFILNQSKLELPGGASLLIDGALTHNDIRPKFDGHLSIDAANFPEFARWISVDEESIKHFQNDKLSVKTSLSVIPRSIRFDNIFIQLGELKSIGSFAVRHYGEPRLYIKSNMRFNMGDFDKFGLAKSFDEFIGGLYAYDYDKSGVKFSNITDDFKWLRQFSYNLSFDFLFDRLKFKNSDYNQSNIAGRIAPNSFTIDHLEFNSEDVTFKGDGELSTLDIMPKINANLHFDYLHDEFIQKIWPSNTYLEDRKNKAYSELVSLGDINAKGVNYYNLNSISGELNLSVNDYVSPALTYQNLSARAVVNEGIVNISALSADIFSGKLKAVGNFVINSLITNGVATYTFNSFNAQEMLQYLINFPRLEGYFGASGSLSSKGATVEDLLANLSGTHSFIGKSVNLQNLDIGEIVKVTENRQPIANKITALNHYLTNGTTVFDDIKGSVIIDRGMGLFKDVYFSNARVSGAYSAKIDFKNNLIGALAKISFIPSGQVTPLSIDFSSNGKIQSLATTINLDQVNQYLLDQARASRQNIEDESIKKLLRNKVTTIGGDIDQNQ
ncbi:MAG: AsmA-like C-terminal region-containing protein [Alphaproteobacteria bacterium]